MPDDTRSGKKTIDLSVFCYDDFLDFLEWTINNKKVAIGTLDNYRSAVKGLYKEQKIPLPNEYTDDMKEVYSGAPASYISPIIVLKGSRNQLQMIYKAGTNCTLESVP